MRHILRLQHTGNYSACAKSTSTYIRAYICRPAYVLPYNNTRIIKNLNLRDRYKKYGNKEKILAQRTLKLNSGMR